MASDGDTEGAVGCRRRVVTPAATQAEQGSRPLCRPLFCAGFGLARPPEHLAPLLRVECLPDCAVQRETPPASPTAAQARINTATTTIGGHPR
jgi:hypothetical protein